MRVRVSERELLDPGYRRAYVPPAEAGDAPLKAGESRLRDLQKGQRVKPRHIRARRQGLSEAGLIGLMQKRGIGRPATYAGVIEGLLGRGYVQRREDDALEVSERGRAVLAFLLAEYPDLFSLEFTAQMESWLDEVARGGRDGYERAVRRVWEMLGKG